MIVIETENLTKRFGETVAVKNLNLEVPKGGVFGFLGENGAGKTTTIKLLLGLLKPDEGRAKVLGEEVALDGGEFRKKVGYVPESRAVYPYFTVEEIIKFTASFYEKWDEKKVERYLKLFNLPLKKKVKSLSKGMRAQLSLLLALGHSPEILILDEPTEGMDPVARREFLTTIINELLSNETTIFLSSHILTEVERVADYIGLIHKGNLITSGPLEKIKEKNFRLKTVFSRDLQKEEILRVKGVLEASGERNTWVLEVKGDFSQIEKELRELGAQNLERVHLNLEEIFFRYVEVKKDESSSL
jgi:ABC-2 type transport system ATP-binding protein